MERVFTAVVILLVCFANVGQADVFNMGVGLTNLEMATVGDPGNVADTRVMSDGTSGYGSVNYSYNIGKYEVTAAQYCDFLNHKAKSDPYGLYDTIMYLSCKINRTGDDGSYSYSVADDWANKPVNYVSFWDACRFANWLNNGQGCSDTETGAYTLFNKSDGDDFQRNTNWKFAITSEDEWYKAAYYKSGGIDVGYWLYPTQSDTVDTMMANYDNPAGTTTIAGSYPYAGAYGTFDQGGNVVEWNEAVLLYGYGRGLRGGSFEDLR